MNTKHLKIFTSLYETLSVTQTAKCCFITQPAVSISLKNFEEELGRQLFIRDSHCITATEAGHELYPKAIRLLDQIASLSNIGTELHHEQLTIGLQVDLCPSKVQIILTFFRKQFPDMGIHLVRPGETCDFYIGYELADDAEQLFLPLWKENYAMFINAELENSAEVITVLCDDVNKLSRVHGGSLQFVTKTGGHFEIDRHRDIEIQLRECVKAGYGAARFSRQWIRDDNLIEISDVPIKSIEIGVNYHCSFSTSSKFKLVDLLSQLFSGIVTAEDT
ncbi:LysR family transcriptional regulator [Ferrimonas senticii]|uniref:LysR family transcriptional regulator n=1 Tax=Ferrimonas senticii TaxID=394566 RepID=UPI0004819F08|nr:LysR family transcriptional regulator [Ferrimonas senticii]